MKKLRRSAAFLLPFLLGSLPSCSSDPEPGPEPLTAEQEREKRELERLLRLFVADHADWPTERDRALRDPRMGEMLVKNLIKFLVETSRNRFNKGLPLGSWSPYRRCQEELVTLSQHAIPELVLLHQVIHSRERVDPVVLFPVQDTLMAIGDPALPILKTRYSHTTDRRERESLLKIVSGIASLDGLSFLEGRLKDDDWQIRARVLEGLGKLGSREAIEDATRARCRSILARRLKEDEDPFCRNQAAKGLGEIGGVESVRVLLKHYREFSLESDERRADERKNLLAALRLATGLPRASSPEEFQAWVERNEAQRGS